MDARVRYTKMVVRNAVLELLEEKDIARITVKSICDLAQINRATFYKYYDNPQDLLQKIEAEVLDELQEKICQTREQNLAVVFRIVLNDILNRKELYLTLFSEHGDVQFKERLFNLCYGNNMVTIRHYFPALSPSKQEWVYYFIAEGCSGLLNRWIATGMQESPEELIDFLMKTIGAINEAGSEIHVEA
ncbi:MAG: TetR/AcrR family transcriptional regulator C-terminal domain-containing protein [Lachnospiraceae bacterium]|nr:TetR/AcrR family transcriptional regulator C-terminal domain-containing protein [Lachnospiraceae bacterium]